MCLSGIEGPRIGVINDPAIMARWYELIAYDCVYYGWTVRWDSTKGKHVVTYDNVVTGAPWDGPWVMAAGLGAQFGGGP